GPRPLSRPIPRGPHGGTHRVDLSRPRGVTPAGHLSAHLLAPDPVAPPRFRFTMRLERAGQGGSTPCLNGFSSRWTDRPTRRRRWGGPQWWPKADRKSVV